MAIEQEQRITALRSRYQVQFERRSSWATAKNNYEYLDILDRAWTQGRLPRADCGVLCDIGCASFWYAAALHAFFSPRRLTGVEIEGYRLFKNGHSRIDYATGYLEELSDARFVVADYRDCDMPADLITAWFPFVNAAAILGWRLPLSLLAPEALFERVHQNLAPEGLFVMVNHGSEEAERATRLCDAAELRCFFRMDEVGVFSHHRARPAVFSCWGRR